ncbi:hypothetical protein PMIN01_00776 [Paraphaeosphaeria minitans]|uniref:Uncharacterized protein n=1 Tax=Paraphaeosphaeria minitans TaxID=565426 RepID=A0A9P6GSW6_9PLEO|nr:hypothetical protein PMIN01_00776 [Paraphaeosphaeria minitans]
MASATNRLPADGVEYAPGVVERFRQTSGFVGKFNLAGGPASMRAGEEAVAASDGSGDGDYATLEKLLQEHETIDLATLLRWEVRHILRDIFAAWKIRYGNFNYPGESGVRLQSTGSMSILVRYLSLTQEGYPLHVLVRDHFALVPFLELVRPENAFRQRRKYREELSSQKTKLAKSAENATSATTSKISPVMTMFTPLL